MRRTLALLAVALGALAFAGTAMAAQAAEAAKNPPKRTQASLVKKLNTDAFGTVLVTKRFQALYYWTPEKNNPGEILCTGACVDAWPILYVPKGVKVPRKIKGYAGTWGTIRRPEGARQLTYNGLPLYTYAHEGPRQVLCDDVNDWFVVRL